MIVRLLELSSEFTALQGMIHACHREYDEAGAEEYGRQLNEVQAAGRALRAGMTPDEIAEFDRRLRERQERRR